MRHRVILRSLLVGSFLVGTLIGSPAITLSNARADARTDGHGGLVCTLGSSATAGNEALADAYRCIAPSLMAGYGQSRHVIARTFSAWETASDIPFVSEDVGQHYVMVFANDRALEHEKTLWLDRGMPIGATLVAVGFSVDSDGVLRAEPLLIYEKMNIGFDTGRGNWRKTLIAPNGTLIGVTNGAGAENVRVCDDCSAGTADRLYLALLNGGVVPMGAPEATPPLPADVDAETNNGAALGRSLGENSDLEDGSVYQGPQVNRQSFSETPDTADPNIRLEPQQPLDPAAPIAPGSAIDPLQPSAQSSTRAPTDDVNPTADALRDAGAPSDLTAPSALSSRGSTAMSDSSLEEDAQTDPDRQAQALRVPEQNGETSVSPAPSQTIESALDLEQSDAFDPILTPPETQAAEPVPMLEAPIAGG